MIDNEDNKLLEEEVKQFRKFVNNYDLQVPEIDLKYHHSLRVMNLALELAADLKLDAESQKIAALIGLLHDYSRFEQWTDYQTFSDFKSFDHGDRAADILFSKGEIRKYLKSNEWDKIVELAIKYHNKKDVPETLNEKERLFANIIRDADKIDILYLETLEQREDNNLEISPKVAKTFYNKQLIDKKDVLNENDKIIVILSFFFDINFKFSYQYLKDNKILDRLFATINNKKLFAPYFEFVKEYIDIKLS